jgi:hypothetical protein
MNNQTISILNKRVTGACKEEEYIGLEPSAFIHELIGYMDD